MNDPELNLREADLGAWSDEELFDELDQYYTPDAAMDREGLILCILQEEYGYERVKVAHPDFDEILEEGQERYEARDVLYPKIRVQLVGMDGNAFAILGRVKSALRKGGVSAEEQAKFVEEAMSGGYDQLLATCMRWVDCR